MQTLKRTCKLSVFKYIYYYFINLFIYYYIYITKNLTLVTKKNNDKTIQYDDRKMNSLFETRKTMYEFSNNEQNERVN